MNLVIRVLLCIVFGFLVSRLSWALALSLIVLFAAHGGACMWAMKPK